MPDLFRSVHIRRDIVLDDKSEKCRMVRKIVFDHPSYSYDVADFSSCERVFVCMRARYDIV